MQKEWANYFDSDGLIRNSDTGDSARETGTYLSALEANPETAKILSNLLEKCLTPSGFIRHPHPTDPWHANPHEFSRDQLTPILLAFIIHRRNVWFQDEIDQAFAIQRQHFFKAQNKDIIGWEHTLYARIIFKWYLYPAICIFDLGLLINVLIRVVKSYFLKDDTADDLNISTMCIVLRKHIPTPFVYLSCWFYKLRKGGVFSAWVSYYQRPEAPPQDTLWKPLLMKYLN